MRRSFRKAARLSAFAFGFASAMTFAPMSLVAQGTSACAVANSDGCQKADDMYSYMLPQLGLGLSGGNPILGSGSVIGKLGHFSLGVRGTAFKGGIPQFDHTAVDPNQRVVSNIAVKESWFGGAGADAAVGLFGGFALGVTRVGSLDALASVMYLPDIGDGEGSNSGDATITIKTHTRFGFGARVGLLEEGVALPGVSFAYLQRGLPKISLSAETENATQLGVEDLSVSVSTWRVIATKNFLAFALSAGVGGDKYTADGDITARFSSATATDRSTLSRDISRTNWFIDLTINLGPIKLAGEYGGASKTTVNTFNTFDPTAGGAVKYYSAGLRIGF